MSDRRKMERRSGAKWDRRKFDVNRRIHPAFERRVNLAMRERVGEALQIMRSMSKDLQFRALLIDAVREPKEKADA